MVYETLNWEISRIAFRLTRSDEELTIARAVIPHDERRRRVSRMDNSNDTVASTLSIAIGIYTSFASPQVLAQPLPGPDDPGRGCIDPTGLSDLCRYQCSIAWWRDGDNTQRKEIF